MTHWSSLTVQIMAQTSGEFHDCFMHDIGVYIFVYRDAVRDYYSSCWEMKDLLTRPQSSLRTTRQTGVFSLYVRLVGVP